MTVEERGIFFCEVGSSLTFFAGGGSLMMGGWQNLYVNINNIINVSTL